MAMILTRRALSLLTSGAASSLEASKVLCATTTRHLHQTGLLQEHDEDKSQMKKAPSRQRKPPPSYITDAREYEDYMPKVMVAEGGPCYATPDYTPLRTSITDPQYIPDRSEWRRLN